MVQTHEPGAMMLKHYPLLHTQYSYNTAWLNSSIWRCWSISCNNNTNALVLISYCFYSNKLLIDFYSGLRVVLLQENNPLRMVTYHTTPVWIIFLKQCTLLCVSPCINWCLCDSVPGLWIKSQKLWSQMLYKKGITASLVS